MYYTDPAKIPFPQVEKRNVMHGHGRTHFTRIPGRRAIVNIADGYTYDIVSSDYKLVPHQEVVDMMEKFVTEIPGLAENGGEIQREFRFSNNSGRMKVKYTFPGITFDIRPGDNIALTLESFASFDTSLAQRTFFGFFRLVCSNGAKIGRLISEYKHKHTQGLDLDKAFKIVSEGLEKYPDAVEQLRTMNSRNAFLREINLYEGLPFQKDEKEAIESAIKKGGKVITWDNDKPDNRVVEINAWDMYNILTREITHSVVDITRQQRLFDAVAANFN